MLDAWILFVTAPAFLWGWVALAAVVAGSLTRLSAPYGRHARSGWGPSFSARGSWMVMEAVSLAAFWVCVSVSSSTQTEAWLCVGLYTTHYGYRSFIYPLLGSSSAASVPLSVSAMAVVFNIVNGSILGGVVLGWGTEVPAVSIVSVLGVALFAAGFLIHVRADAILRGLRRKHGAGYHIPEGFLYRYVSCPNYLGEVIQWVGFACMLDHLGGWTFAVWTAANLVPRALDHHRWYRERFPDYPPQRKALVPGLL